MTGSGRFFFLVCAAAIVTTAGAQHIRSVDAGTGKGLTVCGFTGADGRVQTLSRPVPLLSFWLNDTLVSTASFTSRSAGDSISWTSSRKLNGVVRMKGLSRRGVQLGPGGTLQGEVAGFADNRRQLLGGGDGL